MTNLKTPIQEIKLTPHQQQSYDAIAAFAKGETDATMMSLVGYAGTGKTTLISELINELKAGDQLRIAIAAPTNKAVGVLKEKIPVYHCIDFGSIHSFLGLRMKERDNGEQECSQEGKSTLHEYDLVIIDESSMLGKDLFKLIALSLRGSTRVIFIGDPCQLPPVGEKDQSPVFEMVQRKTALTEVVRQAKDNPIIALSMRIRQCIEQDEITTPAIIADTLPPVETGPTACVAYGGTDTIRSWALHERKANRDCRILAFTNYQVKQYNAFLREALYGLTECAFVEGEQTMVHEQTEALGENGHVTLHTSEELVVTAVSKKPHPKWDEVEAFELTLKRDNGDLVKAYLAADQEQLQAMINANFQAWRELKAEAKRLKDSGDASYPIKEQEAKSFSGKAWALRKAFAPLRHVYAITTHKSQGSTFDTAIVDYNDLAKIRSAFDFNRALYVAVTRPREYLAIVL